MSAAKAADQLSDEGRGYAREAAVEADIRRLAGVPRGRLAAVALAAGQSVREEALVHLVRLCRRDGDNQAAADLVRGLVRRITPKVSRTVGVWRLGAADSVSDDVIDEILVDFYEQVFSDDPSALFWEVRFWVCLERRLLNIVRRRRAELDRQADEAEGDGEDEYGDFFDDQLAAAPSAIDDPEMAAVMAEALGQLPEAWRTAFILKHWCGYHEEVRSDPTEATIATIMGITGRTVRNYLAHAEERLARWREGAPAKRAGGPTKTSGGASIHA